MLKFLSDNKLSNSASSETHLPRAIESWYSEISKYDASDPQNALTMDVFNSGVGHFTAACFL